MAKKYSLDKFTIGNDAELQNSVPENNISESNQVGLNMRRSSRSKAPAEEVGQFFTDGSMFDDGISFQDATTPMGIESHRHEEQPWYASLGAAANQAIVGEIFGGTIEGLGYLLDIPQYLALADGTEKEFGNLFSDFGKSMRTWSQEATPIYTDPSKEGGFNPEDWSWWMTNLPSVASTLSLLVPSGLAVKGLSTLSKMTKLSKGLDLINEAGQITKTGIALKGITQAVVSRHMESLMEAAGTAEDLRALAGQQITAEQAQKFRDNYGISVQPSGWDDNGQAIFKIDENMANELGAKAASLSYKANWAMLAQDIPQYIFMNTPFGKVTEKLTAGLANKLGQSGAKVAMGDLAKGVWNSLGEGGEEAYQYAVGEKSKELALMSAGLMDERDLSESLKDYATRGDMWTSAFFGMAGAGVTQSVGKHFNKALGRIRGIESEEERRGKDMDSWAGNISYHNNLIFAAEQAGREDFANAARKSMVVNTAINAAKNGNLGHFIETLKAMEESTDQDAEIAGVTPEMVVQAKKNNPNLIKDIERIGELFQNNLDKHGAVFAPIITEQEFKIESASSELNSVTSKLNNEISNIPNFSKLSPTGQSIFRLDNDIAANTVLLNSLEARHNSKDSSKDPELVKASQNRISSVKEDIKFFESQKNDLEYSKEDIAADKKVNITSPSIEKYGRLNVDKVYLEEELASAQEYVEKAKSQSWQAAQLKKAKEREDSKIKEAAAKAENSEDIDGIRGKVSGTNKAEIVEQEIASTAAKQAKEGLNQEPVLSTPNIQTGVNQEPEFSKPNIQTEGVNQEPEFSKPNIKSEGVNQEPEYSKPVTSGVMGKQSNTDRLLGKTNNEGKVTSSESLRKGKSREEMEIQIKAKIEKKKKEELKEDYEQDKELALRNFSPGYEHTVSGRNFMKIFNNRYYSDNKYRFDKIDAKYNAMLNDEIDALNKSMPSSQSEIEAKHNTELSLLDEGKAAAKQVPSQNVVQESTSAQARYKGRPQLLDTELKGIGKELGDVEINEDTRPLLDSYVKNVKDAVSLDKWITELNTALANGKKVHSVAEAFNNFYKKVTEKAKQANESDEAKLKLGQPAQEVTPTDTGDEIKDLNVASSRPIVKRVQSVADGVYVSRLYINPTSETTTAELVTMPSYVPGIDSEGLNSLQYKVGDEIRFEIDKSNEYSIINRPIVGKAYHPSYLISLGSSYSREVDLMADIGGYKSSKVISYSVDKKNHSYKVKLEVTGRNKTVVIDGETGDASIGIGIRTVIYKDGKRNVVGNLPTAEAQKQPSAKAKLKALREAVFDDLMDKYEGSEQIVTSDIKSKVTGIAGNISRANAMQNPTDVLMDSHKDELSDFGGFIIGYTKTLNGKEVTEFPKTDIPDMATSVDNNGQIIIATRNPVINEPFILRAFVKKLSAFEQSDREFYDKSFYKAVETLLSLKEDGSNIKEVKASFNKILYSDFTYNDKTKTLYFDKNHKISYDDLINKRFNKVVHDANNIQTPGYKATVKSLLNNMHFSIQKEHMNSERYGSNFVPYNSEVNKLLELNIKPKQYFDSVSLLVDLDYDKVDTKAIENTSSEVISEERDSINMGVVSEEYSEESTIEREKARELELVEKQWLKDIDKDGYPMYSLQEALQKVEDKYKNRPFDNETVNKTISDENKADKKRTRKRFDTGLGDTSKGMLDDLNEARNMPKARRAQDGVPLWNKAEELAWFKKNFPSIPMGKTSEIMSHIKEVMNHGEEAWGAFMNASVYFNDNAGVGTAYHEAFHVIFNLYLNTEQQTKVLKDAIGKTTIEKEEWLADQFMDKLAGIQKNKSWTKAISDFFTKLYYTVKSMFTSDISSINEIARRADVGMYRKSPVKLGKFSSNSLKLRIADWSYRKEKVAVDAINKDLLNSVVPALRASNVAFSNMTDTEIMNVAVKSKGPEYLYQQVYNNIMTTAEKAATQEEADKLYELSDYLFNEDGNAGKLFAASIRGLANNNGINVTMKEVNDSESRLDDEFDFRDSEESFNENWMTHFTEISAKNNAPYRIKSYIRYLKTGKLNEFYLPEYVDYDDTYNNLLASLSNSNNVTEMISKLKDSLSFHSEYAEIIERLENDPTFQSEFFFTFSKTHTKFSMVFEKDGKYILTDANRKGIVKEIITKWTNSVLASNQLLDIDDNFNYTVDLDKAAQIKQIMDGIAAKKVLEDSDIETLHKITKYLGFEIPISVFKYVVDNNIAHRFVTGQHSLHIIVNKFAEGKNPFDSEAGLDVSEAASINQLAKTTKKAMPSLFESSFKNIDGKSQYSHLIPNYLAKMVNKLHNKNTAKKFIDGFQRDSMFKTNVILNELYSLRNDEDALSDMFDFSIVDGLSDSNGKIGYADMKQADLQAMSLAAFYNNGNKSRSFYRGPVLSDASNMVLFKFKRYSSEEAIDHLFNLAKAEYTRIQELNAHDSIGINNFNSDNNLNTETGYHIMPMFNGFKGSPEDNEVKAKKLISEWFNEKIAAYKESLKNSNVLVYEGENVNYKKSRIDERISEKGIDSFLSEFYLNDYLMRANFSLITVGDPAFYKPEKGTNNVVVDYTKRAKEIYSPKYISNVGATFVPKDGSEIITVSESYNSIYLNDNNIQAPSYDSIAEAIDEAVKTGHISKSKARVIKASYNGKSRKDNNGINGQVNQTDAQAYISLPFYRETLVSLGRWTDKHQDAYPRLLEGNGTANDMALVMQPLKPFMYTQIWNPAIKKMVPVQHKNSEYLLLPQLTNKNPKLKKILDLMDSKNVGVVNFESAIKTGLYGATDLENIDNAVVHNIPMEDRGIQGETPAHFQDSNNLFGTQIRKLIMSDLIEGVDYDVKGWKSVKAKELYDMYERIIMEDLAEAYSDAYDTFTADGKVDYKKVSQILMDKSKGEEFEKAIEYDEANDRIRLPLFHPLYASSVENMITSIFKNRVTKQKISGGAFVQASGFGLSEELKLVFDTDENREAYDKYIASSERIAVDKFSRVSAGNDSEYLYLFTDNAGRTSGRNRIPLDSEYSQFFGGKNYPTMTQAVVRGLDNSAPITTMVDDKRTQWTEERFSEWKDIIDTEFDYIQNKLQSGKYKGIKFSSGARFGQGTYSKLPKAFQQYLDSKLLEFGIDNESKPKAYVGKSTQLSPKFKGLKYAEILLPAWSKQFYQDFVDEDGNIDFEQVEKSAPELLEMIGYRIPTEAKYSMMPLKVVGFLPLEGGGAIMLPAEITTISGSDFDVDKMYVMMKSGKRRTANFDQISYDYKNSIQEEVSIPNYSMDEISKRLSDLILDKDLDADFKDLIDEYDGNIKDVASKDLNRAVSEVRALQKEVAKDMKAEASKARKSKGSLKFMQPENVQAVLELYNNKKSSYDNMNIQDKAIVDFYIQNKDKYGELVRYEAAKMNYEDGAKNSKAARNNAKIDLMMAVLRNQATLGDLFNPGGAASLQAIADRINELRGKGKEQMPLFDIATNDEMAVRNMTGKQLVGIAANHTSHHAVRQHFDLSFKDALMFDGKSLGKLGGLKDISGEESISRNYAEISAAVVDNAKDPIAAFVNYNTFTADVISSIIGVGYTHKTAFFFASQPIILELTDRISKDSSKSEQSIMVELADSLGISFNSDVSNISTSSMEKAIGTDNLDTDLQKSVLIAFASYHKQGKALNKLIRASRADTKGLNGTMAHGEMTLALIDDVSDIEFAISGADQMFTGDSMIQSFTDNGIRNPMSEIMEHLLPYNNPLYKAIKTAVNDNLNNRDLSEDMRNSINRQIMSFYLSGFQYFNLEERNDISKGLPLEFFKYIEEHPEMKNNDLFKRLGYEAKTDKIPIDRLVFNNTGSLTDEQRVTVQRAFEDLLDPQISEPHAVEMAHKLLKYAYFSSGMNFTASSFAHLIPVDAYLSKMKNDKGNSMVDYVYRLQEFNENVKDISKSFLEQFYRNNYSNKTLVPRVNENATNINSISKDKNYIYLTDDVKDKSFLVKTGKYYAPVSFIAQDLDKSTNLYRFMGTDQNGTYTYQRVNKLGVPNYIIEYNINMDNMESIIESNNLSVSNAKHYDTKVAETATGKDVSDMLAFSKPNIPDNKSAEELAKKCKGGSN